MALQRSPEVRALAPGERGFNLDMGTVAAQQESTEEFFAFLDSQPAADERDDGQC
jgi:hypothetical protein